MTSGVTIARRHRVTVAGEGLHRISAGSGSARHASPATPGPHGPPACLSSAGRAARIPPIPASGRGAPPYCLPSPSAHGVPVLDAAGPSGGMPPPGPCRGSPAAIWRPLRPSVPRVARIAVVRTASYGQRRQRSSGVAWKRRFHSGLLRVALLALSGWLPGVAPRGGSPGWHVAGCAAETGDLVACPEAEAPAVRSASGCDAPSDD
jgi:hypothetical protein